MLWTARTKKNTFHLLIPKNSRAWELLHKYSNNLNISENWYALRQILRVKKNQNLFRKRTELSITDTVSSSFEPETASDTMSIKSRAKKSIKISPSLINKRVIRMFLRFFKTNLDEFFKTKNLNLIKDGSTMSKALFDELVITYMDVIFGDTLDMLDENKVDKIIQSLSTILLKDRHSYYEGKNWNIGEIAQGLDFDEVKQLAYSPSYEKTLKYISQEGNSVLYVYFFLTE